ncbi:HAD-IB family hydrolase [Lysobacter sp. H21R4]|uniref:HAD-IB family hydrolase n=1 Tax=Lysobacter sp. H21R4 TaxID=2781021 RepID=UPI001887D805|nr:HAD-IB family hydrolase [Lysobacter sp. H21R4]QOY62671.1 HAD-IB family hydrolase [Lysobacter sp. H21R4]
MDLALFDFDGTISDRQTMPDFMHAAVRPGRLLAGKLLLMPLIVGYRLGVVSGSVVRAAICLLGFWRVPAAEVEALGAAFAADVIPGTLRAEMLERIAWHKSREDTVVVVSGGLDLYLRQWARGHDLALLCSSLEQRGHRLTGFYGGRQCVGEEKVRRIQEKYRLADFDRVHAYGDSVEDAAMLAMADERWYRGKCLPSGQPLALE